MRFGKLTRILKNTIFDRKIIYKVAILVVMHVCLPEGIPLLILLMDVFHFSVKAVLSSCFEFMLA